MTLKLNGSSSGYTAIDAPAAAGSNTLVLPTTNGSAGQVLKTDGSGNLSWVTVPSITESSYTACGTGTTSEITGVPASAKEILVYGVDISFGANSAHLRLRLGGAGGYKTSGYKVTACEGGGSQSGAAETDGFTQMYVGAGAYTMNLMWRLVNVNANLWNLTGYTNAGNGTETTDFRLNGTVDLAETLTKLQFDADSGASFDGGSWRFMSTVL